MAEYSREQGKKLSRVIGNGAGRSQQKDLVDNHTLSVFQQKMIGVVQKKDDLECETTINYLKLETGKQCEVKEKGKNNSKDKHSVVETICKHPQTAWIGRLQQPKGGNPTGQCAEPHSLSAALSKIEVRDKISSIVQSPAKFIKEVATDATTWKKEHNKWKNLGKRGKSRGKQPIKKEPEKRYFAVDKHIGDSYPPCKTCEQWVYKLFGIGDNWTDFADVAD